MTNMTLPAEIIPECWSDDMRMDALFAPFRVKSLNPVGWEAKMNFWLDIINKWSDTTNKPTFTLRELKNAFKRKNKVPNCLDMVMQHMTQNGAIKNLTDLEKENANTWTNWGIKQILRPATWAMNKLLSPVLPSEQVNKDVVVVVHLETMKKLALQLFSSVSDERRIGYIAELKEITSNKNESTMTTLLINWLVSQKLAVLSEDGSIYKFANNKAAKVNSITESEVCLLQLSKAKQQLESVMNNLDKSILESRETAKRHLANKNKSLALHHLKIKKRYEARLLKISNSAETLINLSETIQQTHTDAEILVAYKKGLKGLKGTMDANGLNESSVFDTMDDLKQILEDYSNIEAALAEPIGPNVDIEDIDLEEELNNLVIDGNDENNHGNISSLSEDGATALKTDIDDLNIVINNPGDLPDTSIQQDITKKKIAITN